MAKSCKKNIQADLASVKYPRSSYDYTCANKYQKRLGCASPEEVFTRIDEYLNIFSVSLGVPFYWDHARAEYRVPGAKCYPARWKDGREILLSYAHVILHLAGVYTVFAFRKQERGVTVAMFDLDISGRPGIPERLRLLRQALATFPVASSLRYLQTPSGGVHAYAWFRTPLTQVQWAMLYDEIARVIPVKNGTLEVYPQEKRTLRLPLGIRTAPCTPDGLGLLAGCERYPSKIDWEKYQLRRNISLSLSHFREGAIEAWGSTTPPKEVLPATHYLQKPFPKIPFKYVRSSLSTYMQEMDEISRGITDVGCRYQQSGRYLWYLSRVQNLSPEEATERYIEWLHLPTHQSKDLTGATRSQVIAQMTRSGTRALYKLARQPREYPEARLVPGDATLPAELDTSGRSTVPYVPTEGFVHIPWATLPLRTRISIAAMIQYLHRTMYNGACGVRWVSYREFAAIVGNDPIPDTERAALPMELREVIKDVLHYVAVIRTLLEHFGLLEVHTEAVHGQNVTRYKIGLERLYTCVYLPKEPLEALHTYMRENSLNQTQAARLFQVSTSVISAFIRGKIAVPDKILWALSEEVVYSPSITGGADSRITGERMIGKKEPKRLSRAEEKASPSIVSAFQKTQQLPSTGPMYEPAKELPIPAELSKQIPLATSWVPGFNRDIIPDTLDLDKFTLQAEYRTKYQVYAEDPFSMTPEQYKVILSLLRVTTNSPTGAYYGLLPILPKFPAQYDQPLPRLHHTDEEAMADLRRMLRAYNRVTSECFPLGFKEKDLPRASMNQLYGKVKDRMMEVRSILYEQEIHPERWVAFYCKNFVEHAKEPVEKFPSFFQVYGPAIIVKCLEWAKHDPKTPRYHPLIAPGLVDIPRVARLKDYYHEMIRFLGCSVLPSDGYIRQVVARWFPGESFGMEVSHCFRECAEQREDTIQRYKAGEWLW